MYANLTNEFTLCSVFFVSFVSFVVMYVFVLLVVAEDLPAGFQPGERPGGRGHQEAIAFIDNLLCVVRVDMRVSARHAAFIADSPDRRHRLHDGRMVVLPRVAEILRQIAFADQHDTDAGHLFQDPRKVVDRAHLFAHDDDQDLAVRAQRPHVGLRVVLLSRRLLMSYGLCSASNTMPSYDAAESAMALSIVGGEKAVIGIPPAPGRG